jgi:hypothetical protein
MSNRRANANFRLKRACHRRPSPESLAAVSAASGDPTALLALDAYARLEPQGNPSERSGRPANLAPDLHR